MNAQLTDATDIELESFVDGSWGQDRTDSMEIARWSKKGDRLYINSGISKADKYGLYIDLETHEIVSDNTSKHSGGNVEINDDSATITVEESGDTEHEIVVSLSGEAFEDNEDNEDNEDENNPEVVADGGEDVTGHVDDATIEGAIQQHDDPDHEDALSVEDVRDLLAHVQYDTEAVWDEWMDNIERNDSHVVAQVDGVIVIDTGERDTVPRALEIYDGPVEVDDIAERVVSTVHHRIAEQIDSQYNWGVSYPRVVRVPDDEETGQRLTEAVVNNLMTRGLSPGQAWGVYGVKIRGNSRNQWATRCGYSDHSAVSEAVRKGLSKLPANWNDE